MQVAASAAGPEKTGHGKRPRISVKEKRKQMAIELFAKAVEEAEKPAQSDFIVPKVDFAMIGPKEAKELLQKSQGNRKIRELHVRWLEKVMRDGKWVFGPPIIIDLNGVLIGGHHRLHAVIRSGLYVPMTVMKGADPQLNEWTNQHKEAKLGDEIHRYGMNNANARGAIVRLAAELTAKRRIPVNSFSDYAEWARVFKGVDWVVENLVGKDPWRKSSITGAFAYAYNTDPDAVKLFCTKMVTGEGLSKTDPVLAFRNWFLWYTATDKDKKDVRKHAIAGGGDERKRVYTFKVLHCIRAAIEKKKPRTLKSLRMEVSLDDLEYFRQANETRAAKKMVNYWSEPRMSSEEFLSYLKEG